VDSIEACLSHGFRSSHIIAMHGPFSKELNMAMMRQLDIKTLVTKDGGKPGGFTEKLEAVRELGAEMIVIGRPAEDADGLPLGEVVDRIAALLEDRE
jgi:precorrin-6x reductase